MENPIVTVATGKLQGKTGTDIKDRIFFSFQGIPYAKPPLGELRFKDPQPPEPWEGVRDATVEGSKCYAKDNFLDGMTGSEDCLVLNVYTPQLPQREENSLLPVMVWIHGGGFTTGSGSASVYGPEFLVSGDVVLVTFNYRIGILGFLSLEDISLGVPGNAGLKDMVMVLKWVQKNIAQFSGDPRNVTIFGESAGAAAVHYLVLSPMAKGLFHRAILQSGTAISAWAQGSRPGMEVVEALGTKVRSEKEALEVLQKASPEELHKASLSVSDLFIVSRRRPYAPVVEKPNKNAFLTMNPIDVIKSGTYNHVPMIFGFNSNEGSISEVMQKPGPTQPIIDFAIAVPYFLNLDPESDIFELVTRKIKTFYYGDEEPTTENLQRFFTLETDNHFLRDTVQSIRFHMESARFPIYLYRLSAECGLNMIKNVYGLQTKGTCHADDLGYLFKSLVTPEIEPGSLEDVLLQRMLTFWTNFARTGNPNPQGPNSAVNVEWKPVERNALNFIDIGDQLTADADPEPERMRFWDEILSMSSSCKL